MSGDALHRLAEAAGIQARWLDVHGGWHQVGPDTLRTVLAALGYPAATDNEITDSEAALALSAATLPPLVTTRAGQPVRLPATGAWRLCFEDGGVLEGQAPDGELPGFDRPGYHALEIGGLSTVLAVAPHRAWGIADAAPGQRPWALAVQLYGLRRPGDGGLGDFQALQDLVPAAARLGAAGIAISPVHAQFSADTWRFSPYSPSSRVALNVLHTGMDVPGGEALEAEPFVRWREASELRLATLRHAFQAADAAELAGFARFRTESGTTLETHARFEALHAAMFGADGSRWNWRTWPEEYRHPANPAVTEFAERHADQVALHAYMQYRADRSLAAAQGATRDAGMPIGLIADLAVGADGGGSHCWSNPAQTLTGMGIGAPPDLLNSHGQSWGIAAFSPRGLRDNGYGAFLAMLRHAMRHAGGVRIDHALGLRRLWVVPDGGSPADGAYLTFPLDTLEHLIALESVRHRAIVLGEDLGTIPEGFQERMAAMGLLGMRVLWFEHGAGMFTDPRTWTRTAAAMTSTHDLATVSGWWQGRDLEWRKQVGTSGGPDTEAQDAAARARDRMALWSAFQHSGAAHGPAPAPDDPVGVVDASIRHLATAACDLAILPLEDALALTEQPNLPGTTDQHPNWRRRTAVAARDLLDGPEVAARIAPLNRTPPSPITASIILPATARTTA